MLRRAKSEKVKAVRRTGGPPRPGARTAIIAFAAATTVGLMLFAYMYLDDIARGRRPPVLEPLIEELSSAYGLLLLLGPVVRFARRFRLDGRDWLRVVPLHLGMAACMSVLLTSFRWAARSALFPLAGLGTYDYGVMSVRYFMELPMDVVTYGVVVVGTYMLDHFRAARDRELKVSQLETQLVRAQLESLRTQLNPHFLFNALNTVSSVMYENVPRADRILSNLSDLLRYTMRLSGEQKIPLEEELDVLRLYVEIMQARFHDRLVVDFAVAPDASSAAVPPLLLQPWVENAIRHGAPAASLLAHVSVRAARSAGKLVLEVEDNGPGISGDWRAHLGKGIGLTNTVERLERLYGTSHHFELRSGAEGGLLVRAELPFETISHARNTRERREAAWSA